MMTFHTNSDLLCSYDILFFSVEVSVGVATVVMINTENSVIPNVMQNAWETENPSVADLPKTAFTKLVWICYTILLNQCG